jgi:hypothetical protein
MPESMSESEDQAIETGSEEVGRALLPPVSRGVATAVISVTAEKILEYSLIALIIVASVAGITVYAVVKKKKSKGIKTVKRKAKTVTPSVKTVKPKTLVKWEY